MPSKVLNPGLIEQEKKELFSLARVIKMDAQLADAQEYLGHFSLGRLVLETDIGMIILQLPASEIVEITERYPKGPAKAVRASDFSFSTNQAFETVMHHCAEPRTGAAPDDAWIRTASKKFLLDLHEAGYAHSVETWHDGKLAAGILMLQVGAASTCLSVYSHQSGAGNAAFIATQQVLNRHGYLLHDSLMPSNISRIFGGRCLAQQEVFMRRRAAHAVPLTFPTLPARLLIIEPTAQGHPI